MQLVTMQDIEPYEFLLRVLREYKGEKFSVDDRLIVDDKPDGILDLALKRMKYLVAEPDQHKFEGNFVLLFATLGVCTSFDYYRRFVRKLTGFLRRDPSTYAERKILLFVDLFNLVSGSKDTRILAPKLFISMLALVEESGEGAVLKNTLGGLVERVQEIARKPKDKRTLLSAAYRVSKQLGDLKHAQALLMAYLALFKEEDLVEEHYVDAAQAIIHALSDPEIDTNMYFKLSVIPSVQGLKDLDEYSNLYELFDIMHQGTVEDFLNYKSESNVMADLGISEGNLLEKIRYLTLCTEGLKRNDDIPFEYLKQKLSLGSQDELETLIVQAVRKGLICAKIDHASSSVMIYRTTIRTFEKDWTELSKQLERLIHQEREMLKHFCN